MHRKRVGARSNVGSYEPTCTLLSISESQTRIARTVPACNQRFPSRRMVFVVIGFIALAIALIAACAYIGLHAGVFIEEELLPLLAPSPHYRCTRGAAKKARTRVLIMTLTPQSLVVKAAARILKRFPLDVQIYPAINGNRKKEVVRALVRSGLRFHGLCGYKLTSWGMLANTLTRHAAFFDQRCRGLRFQAVLEDDMQLMDAWPRFVMDTAQQTLANETALDHLQLGHYGEGYLTSLAGVTRLLERFRLHGIRRCPDQQLNDARIMNISMRSLEWQVPWVNLRRENSPNGDIGRTRHISPLERAALRCLTRDGRAQNDATAWPRFKQYMRRAREYAIAHGVDSQLQGREGATAVSIASGRLGVVLKNVVEVDTSWCDAEHAEDPDLARHDRNDRGSA